MSRALCARLCVILAASLALIGCKCSPSEPEPTTATPTHSAAPAQPKPATASYVGSERCRDCHAQQFGAWQKSQHRAAMQLPTPETVLADFAQGKLASVREPTRVHRDGASYRVDTLGKTYDVKYTFGVRPLQQYLLDVGGGRLQALTVAYDTRTQEQGGRRWYQLQPHEKTAPGDELHWTAAAYNWNTSCADCHSTHLQKRYDREHDRYDTQFSELSVGCEACHGPASQHVEQATRGAFAADHGLLRRFATPRERHWTFTAPNPIATLASGSATSPEVEACATCHAHRVDLGGDSLEFHDRYRLDVLSRDLYYPDGQQKAETFELGSFMQSKMYAAGVVCSDCHEPHSGSLRRPGNALCGGCHDAQHYDTPQHHLHTSGTTPSQCVTCHMPTHTFMEIDARREHRLAVPRPDLTLTLGVPNPCTDACHSEQRRGAKPAEAAASWASAAIREHFGPEREPSFAPALAAGQQLAATGLRDLLSVARNERFPAIARATALSELGSYAQLAPGDVAPLARDVSPLVRRALAELLGERGDPESAAALLPLLNDPVRSVRLEAARHMLGRAEAAPVLADLRRSLEHNADRAGALLELIQLEHATGASDDTIEQLFSRAEALEPSLAGSYVNHADFERQRGHEEAAHTALLLGLQKSRDRAPLEHALGLWEIRHGDKPAGLEHLKRAFELSPSSGQLGYVYAVALSDAGRRAEAIRVLEQLHHAAPGDLGTLELLTTLRAAR